MKHSIVVLSLVLSAFVMSFALSASAQDASQTAKPADHARVFITDSQSWEVHGGGGGNWAGFGEASSGGARPQTAEIIKTFGERCSDVSHQQYPGEGRLCCRSGP